MDLPPGSKRAARSKQEIKIDKRVGPVVTPSLYANRAPVRKRTTQHAKVEWTVNQPVSAVLWVICGWPDTRIAKCHSAAPVSQSQASSRQAGSAIALHTCPSPQDTFCPGFKRS